ncbi:MAG: hypothetical protein N2Z22_12115 [Turneriella sp.]|nr:hypothetical protein [Turneriella sp.]
MKKNQLLLSAALAGIALAGTVSAKEGTIKKTTAPVGECHGVNSCRGQSDCATKAHSCAGQNACKGQGWKKMTEAQCKAKKGRFQPLTMEM